MSRGNIEYQISIRGRGLRKLTHAAAAELVDRHIEGEPIPEGIEVDIYAWRQGKQIDWESSVNLRAILRRLVQNGDLRISVRRG